MISYSTKVTRKGQITIPAAIRKSHGIEEGDSVLVREQDGQIVLESSRDWVARTSGIFAKYSNNLDTSTAKSDREWFESATADEVAQSMEDETLG